MSKIRTAITALIVVVLVVSTIAGITFYYNGVVKERNSQIASLNNQVANQNNEIANLNSQNSNLTAQVANVTNLMMNSTSSAYLTASLNITNVQGNATLYSGFGQTAPNTYPYSYLSIEGTVTNLEAGMAYYAGLQVIAYDNHDNLAINMSIPLSNNGIFDVAGDPVDDTILSGLYGGSDRTALGVLAGHQTAEINIQIYYYPLEVFPSGSPLEVTNFTATPFWSNSP